MPALSLSRVEGIQKDRVKGGPIGTVLPKISEMHQITPLAGAANKFDMHGGPGNNPLETADQQKRKFAIGRV
jgi:hypothetical protein